jgi:hypothetical protein
MAFPLGGEICTFEYPDHDFSAWGIQRLWYYLVIRSALRILLVGAGVLTGCREVKVDPLPALQMPRHFEPWAYLAEVEPV